MFIAMRSEVEWNSVGVTCACAGTGVRGYRSAYTRRLRPPSDSADPGIPEG